MVRGKHVFAGIVACAALLVAVTSAEARMREQASFDVYLLGLRAGTLSYAMEQNAATYAVSGKIRSSGLIGTIREFRMDASASGRKTGERFLPERYTETSTENDKRDARSITYDARGAPLLTTSDKPRDYWVPPARQAGALDPMTSVYEMLRDRAGASPCGIDTLLGDGARMGRITSRPETSAQDEVTCAGLYERRGGFSKKQLKDGTRFPFTLTYRRAGAVWELTELRIDSVHGRAQLVRR